MKKEVKQMFCAAFEDKIQTDLIPLSDDPDSKRGGVSAQVIHNLCKAFLPDFIQPGDIFM